MVDCPFSQMEISEIAVSVPFPTIAFPVPGMAAKTVQCTVQASNSQTRSKAKSKLYRNRMWIRSRISNKHESGVRSFEEVHRRRSRGRRRSRSKREGVNIKSG